MHTHHPRHARPQQILFMSECGLSPTLSSFPHTPPAKIFIYGAVATIHSFTKTRARQTDRQGRISDVIHAPYLCRYNLIRLSAECSPLRMAQDHPWHLGIDEHVGADLTRECAIAGMPAVLRGHLIIRLEALLYLREIQKRRTAYNLYTHMYISAHTWAQHAVNRVNINTHKAA